MIWFYLLLIIKLLIKTFHRRINTENSTVTASKENKNLLVLMVFFCKSNTHRFWQTWWIKNRRLTDVDVHTDFFLNLSGWSFNQNEYFIIFDTTVILIRHLGHMMKHQERYVFFFLLSHISRSNWRVNAT